MEDGDQGCVPEPAASAALDTDRVDNGRAFDARRPPDPAQTTVFHCRRSAPSCLSESSSAAAAAHAEPVAARLPVPQELRRGAIRSAAYRACLATGRLLDFQRVFASEGEPLTSGTSSCTPITTGLRTGTASGRLGSLLMQTGSLKDLVEKDDGYGMGAPSRSAPQILPSISCRTCKVARPEDASGNYRIRMDGDDPAEIRTVPDREHVSRARRRHGGDSGCSEYPNRVLQLRP
jgi:hypothetical protein